MDWSREDLENLYWGQNKSLQQIADLSNSIPGHIRYVMKKLGIPRRTWSQALLILRAKHWDEKQLKELYWEQQKSTYDIATILGVSRSDVIRAFRRLNIPIRTKEERNRLAGKKLTTKRGEACGKAWKGGRIKYHSGYIKVQSRGHPYADSHGYVLEHRLVMEKRLGRYLLPWERVHHIDGQRDHNTDDNLQLISPADHTLYTRMCAHCELRKKVRLLEWRIKQLERRLQYKLSEEL